VKRKEKTHDIEHHSRVIESLISWYETAETASPRTSVRCDAYRTWSSPGSELDSPPR